MGHVRARGRTRTCLCLAYRERPPEATSGRRCEARDTRTGTRCSRPAGYWRAIRGQGSLHARDLELCDQHSDGGVFVATISSAQLGCDTWPDDAAWFPDAALTHRATMAASVTA
jgi:hypothetical protein